MRALRLVVAAAAAFLLGDVVIQAQPAAPVTPTPMGLTSSSYTDGGVIPDRYSVNSPAPASPALAWTNVPAGAVSFALIMHDPDTVPNKGVIDTLHWLAFNIPGAARALPEGLASLPQLPDGTIQINNRSGKAGFMAPAGRGSVYHHYTIELFALDVSLNLAPSATRADVLAAMDGHVLSKGVLVGLFHR